MFFQVQALGRVECDPELEFTKEGIPHATFLFAVDKKRCVQDITVPLICWAWGDLAKTVKQSITKGSMLFVQGDFTPYRYTAEDGTPELNLEVTIEKFSFVE